MNLELWLATASRGLSPDAAAQVRTEIQQHYDDTLAHGAGALAALGDPRAANRAYRKVMLTAAEVRYLNGVKREARAICARPQLKNVFIGLPVLLLCFSSAAYFGKAPLLAEVLFSLGLVLGLWLAVPFLPIYTLSRSRVYRVVKWAGLMAALALLAGPSVWLLPSLLGYSLYQVVLSYSLRRKLPVAQWPKALYL